MFGSGIRDNIPDLQHCFSVANPVSGAFLTPWIRVRNPGSVKNQDPDTGSGSGMNIPDHISESLEAIFWVKIHKFFDADPDPEFFDPGSGI